MVLNALSFNLHCLSTTWTWPVTWRKRRQEGFKSCVLTSSLKYLWRAYDVSVIEWCLRYRNPERYPESLPCCLHLVEIKKTKSAEFDCLVKDFKKNWRDLGYTGLVHLENIHSTNTIEFLLPDMHTTGCTEDTKDTEDMVSPFRSSN